MIIQSLAKDSSFFENQGLKPQIFFEREISSNKNLYLVLCDNVYNDLLSDMT